MAKRKGAKGCDLHFRAQDWCGSSHARRDEGAVRLEGWSLPLWRMWASAVTTLPRLDKKEGRPKKYSTLSLTQWPLLWERLVSQFSHFFAALLRCANSLFGLHFGSRNSTPSPEDSTSHQDPSRGERQAAGSTKWWGSRCNMAELATKVEDIPLLWYWEGLVWKCTCSGMFIYLFLSMTNNQFGFPENLICWLHFTRIDFFSYSCFYFLFFF